MTDMVFRSCDPREFETPIRELFMRNGHPEFESVFERAYRPRAEGGLRSWIGQLGDRVVMHVSVSPQVFGDGRVSASGGIMGDLMADESCRDFWAPLRLLRTMLADVRRLAQLDFLLTTTTPEARSLFRAAGFEPFGHLCRHILPLARPYLAFARVRARAKAGTVSVHALQDPGIAADLPALMPAGLMRPEPGPGFYGTRIPRREYSDGTWLRLGDASAPPTALLLVSARAGLPEAAIADLFWSTPAALAEAVFAAATWARRAGYARLTASVPKDSRVSAALRRCGFVARRAAPAMFLRRLTGVALPSTEAWCFTSFAASTW